MSNKKESSLYFIVEKTNWKFISGYIAEFIRQKYAVSFSRITPFMSDFEMEKARLRISGVVVAIFSKDTENNPLVCEALNEALSLGKKVVVVMLEKIPLSSWIENEIIESYILTGEISPCAFVNDLVSMLSNDIVLEKEIEQKKETNLVFEGTFTTESGENKTVRVICGDLTDLDDKFDVVVCSAFKNRYFPLKGTLIGSLCTKKGIVVDELSKNPELDLRMLGGWISKGIENSNINRIACVEMEQKSKDVGDQNIAPFNQVFSTLNFLPIRAHRESTQIKPTMKSGCRMGYLAVL